MHRAFAQVIDRNIARLDADESGHLTRVLRMKDGNEFEVIDGKGGLYRCSLRFLSKHEAVGDILSQTFDRAPSPLLTLAMAPTKNVDRTEWLLEKATELGVYRFVPLLCNHSERKQLRRDRLERIAIAATKQSGRLWMPLIDELTSIQDFLKEDKPASRLIAHCRPGEKQSLHQAFTDDDTVVLIGPEGDFSEDEITRAIAAGYTGISLGENRLRTETAALKVCAVYFK